MKPFVVWTPEQGYAPESGGIKVLHWLCHELNQAGQKAYITSGNPGPCLNTPRWSGGTDDFIAIYPEMVQDNPLGAKTVVRWILYKQEKDYDREIARVPKLIKSLKTIPVLKDVFLPVNKRDVVRSIQRFFIDSLAVAIVVKNNHSTSEYANWFLDWTEELHKIWVNPSMRKLKTP